MKRLASGVLGVAICFASAHALAFDAACPFGVNAHQASNEALDVAAAAGVAWVRYDMNWTQAEPAKGAYDWADADRFVDHAVGLGQHVYMTLAYTPDWAVGAPCNDADPNPANWCHNAPPGNVSDWTDFVTSVVARYGSKVKHFGMWNEPNLVQFFKGSRDAYVAAILVPGSDAVHAACADCKVLGPELANLRSATWDANEGTCVAGQCIYNGWNHSLSEILKAAASSIDVISHHKYYDSAAGYWASACDGDFQVIQLVNGIKQITDAYAPGKPVWITEFGWQGPPFGGDDDNTVATKLTDTFQGMRNVQLGIEQGVMNQPWPELEKMFWYDLEDNPSAESYGLVDANLAPKPAYAAYASIVQSLGCYATMGSGGGAAGSGTGGAAATTGSGGALTGAGGAAGTGGASGGSSGSGAPAPGPAADQPGADGGCGCRAARSDAKSPQYAGLLGAGVVLALLKGRRRLAMARRARS